MSNIEVDEPEKDALEAKSQKSRLEFLNCVNGLVGSSPWTFPFTLYDIYGSLIREGTARYPDALDTLPFSTSWKQRVSFKCLYQLFPSMR